jgi:hypothetical protein
MREDFGIAVIYDPGGKHGRPIDATVGALEMKAGGACSIKKQNTSIPQGGGGKQRQQTRVRLLRANGLRLCCLYLFLRLLHLPRFCFSSFGSVIE